MARALLVALAIALTFCASATAAGPLVALGDSYSSGEGAPPFLPGTDERGANTCHRSMGAWPMLVGIDSDRPVVPLACSGARMDHILRTDHTRKEQGRRTSQLDRLRAFAPEVVTLTIGGNDVGFAEVLRKCATPLARRCDRIYVKSEDELARRIADREDDLARVYDAVQAAAPGARLVVVGYPRIFPQRPALITCTWMERAELRYLNATLDRLNAAIRRAADAAQAAYVDVTDALDRHELSCRSGSWVNPLREGKRFPYSFHPNAKGQVALAGAVKRALRRLGLG